MGWRARRTGGLVVALFAGAITATSAQATQVNTPAGVFTWGTNANGELGNGTPAGFGSMQPTPGPVPGFEEITAIDVGRDFMLALRADGTVWAWGSNARGQLGDGTAVDSTVPVQVIVGGPDTAPLDHVVSIAAGDRHALAVRDDGTVFTWGANDFGKLGYDTPVEPAPPPPPPDEGAEPPQGCGPDDDFCYCPPGNPACECWPFSCFPETIPPRGKVAMQVPGLTDIVAVDGGFDHSVALRSDGRVLAWGDNFRKQLGDPLAGSSRTQPGLALSTTGLETIKAISAGGLFTIALRADGRMLTWGNGSSLGNGHFPPVTSPFPSIVVDSRDPTRLTNIIAVSAGETHGLALRADGLVFSWGPDNDDGKLGDLPLPGLSPEVIFGLTGVSAIAAGGEHSLAIGPHGTVLAWGANFFGQAGIGTTGSGLFQPTPVPGLTGVSMVAAGGHSSAALRRQSVAGDDEYGTAEDAPLTVPAADGVLANDGGSAQAATLVTGPRQGGVQLSADGSFTYTPAANFNGTDTFTYTAGAGPRLVTVAVSPVNDAPTAIDDCCFRRQEEDFVLHPIHPIDRCDIGVMENDFDVDNNEWFRVELVTPPTHGMLELDTFPWQTHCGGAIRYVPDRDFNGPETFVYRAIDSAGASTTATVRLNIVAANDPPVITAPATAQTSVLGAMPVIFSAARGNAITFSDVDINEGANLPPGELSVALRPTNGVVTLATTAGLTFSGIPPADGFEDTICSFRGTLPAVNAALDGLIFKPTAGFGAGGGSLNIAISDNARTGLPGIPLGAVTTLTIQAGAAGDDAYTLAEDTTLTRSAPGVLDNDNAADRTVGLVAALDTPPQHGSVTLRPDGSFEYTPTADFAGTDTFHYVATNTAAPQVSVRVPVTITVTPVNDAPRPVEDVYALAEDTTLTQPGPGVLTNDTDPENDPIAITLATGPHHGTLTLDPAGGFTYTPAPNFNGNDSFTYIASDNSGATSTPTTVHLVITGVNDAPVNTVPGQQNTFPGLTPVQFTPTRGNAITVNDLDLNEGPAPGTLTITLTATNGRVSLGTTTGLTFTHGDGTNDTTMTFTGTTTQINTALNGAVFTPTPPDFVRDKVGSLRIDTNDNGNTGQGGAATDSDTITIEFNQPG